MEHVSEWKCPDTVVAVVVVVGVMRTEEGGGLMTGIRVMMTGPDRHIGGYQ